PPPSPRSHRITPAPAPTSSASRVSRAVAKSWTGSSAYGSGVISSRDVTAAASAVPPGVVRALSRPASSPAGGAGRTGRGSPGVVAADAPRRLSRSSRNQTPFRVPWWVVPQTLAKWSTRSSPRPRSESSASGSEPSLNRARPARPGPAVGGAGRASIAPLASRSSFSGADGSLLLDASTPRASSTTVTVRPASSVTTSRTRSVPAWTTALVDSSVVSSSAASSRCSSPACSSTVRTTARAAAGVRRSAGRRILRTVRTPAGCPSAEPAGPAALAASDTPLILPDRRASSNSGRRADTARVCARRRTWCVGDDGRRCDAPEPCEVIMATTTATTQTSTPDCEALLAELATALRRVRAGDLTARLSPGVGRYGEVADAFNEMVDVQQRQLRDLRRISRVVGREGQLTERLDDEGYEGAFAEGVRAVNSLVDDLGTPATEIARVIVAVAEGDLTQQMPYEIDGRPLRGEFLRIARTVNTMVSQLSSFADEVTRVARDVGTEGKLGGQAQVKGVAGTWRDLTDSVNTMASNLTDQVRSIS